MKKSICVGVVAVILAAAVSSVSFAGKTETGADAVSGGSKVGFVDLNRALNEVNEGKKAKAQLEADGKAKKAKLEIMQNELKKMKEDLDKQRPVLSADVLKQKEGTLQQKFMELQKMSMDFEKEFADKENNYIKPISDKLQKIVQDIGAKEGYMMIVPREMALYSLPGTDLTEKVVSAYNSSK